MNISHEFEQMLIAFGNNRQSEVSPDDDDERTRVYVCDQSKNGYYVIFGDDYGNEMAMETIDNDELFGFIWKTITTLSVS